MAARGLISFFEKDGHRHYFAENPEKVILHFKKEEQELKIRESRFAEILPELSSLYNILENKPKVRLYEGKDGLKQIYEETLLLDKDSEILIYGSSTLIYNLLGNEWIADYLKRRVEKGIQARAIIEQSEMSHLHAQKDKEELRITKILPAGRYNISNEINIFSNKVAIISFKELTGVVFESADVANTQRAIFDLAWESAKLYSASRSFGES